MTAAAENLKAYRAEASLSQAEFAELIGVSQGQVNHWETGRQEISSTRALLIEKATKGKLPAYKIRPDLPWPHAPRASSIASPPLPIDAATL